MAYLPLSTANLPDPAIDPAQGSSPADYFDAFTWTGTGNTGRSFTDLSFQPDLVWAKDRTNAYGNVLFDSVRGAGADKELGSQVTGAEGYASTSTYDYLSSFDSNGFTSTYSGSNFAAYFNNSGDSYVAWNWKANGSGVSNTDGTITSTVSANTTSGFSIVGYAGNSASNQTIGHGLTSTPQMVVHKNRTNANDWVVDVGNITGTAGNALRWNNTSAITNNVAILPNKPTSSVFYVSTDSGEFNVTGRDYIAYCFHSVEGFSKLGSYTGNGSTDGPFVYTGFKPAFVLFKKTNITTASWGIRDNTRYTYNPTRNTLYADKSDAEYTGTAHDVDFLSNGFKPRTTDGLFNSSGATYIYMAFAENPFKFSTAS